MRVLTFIITQQFDPAVRLPIMESGRYLPGTLALGRNPATQMGTGRTIFDALFLSAWRGVGQLGEVKPIVYYAVGLTMMQSQSKNSPSGFFFFHCFALLFFLVFLPLNSPQASVSKWGVYPLKLKHVVTFSGFYSL